MENKYLWGIDLGGTKIEAIVINPSNNFEVLARKRVSTNADKGYEAVLNTIKKLIDALVNDLSIPCQRLGIGTPGSINPYTNLLRNCNSVYLNDKPFRDDLEKLLGLPVRISNDANCFAISEYKMGIVKEIAPKANIVFGAIMGTGIGSGVIVNGQILEGKNGVGGEWGHNFLDESGGQCYCGKVGCVETVISGPALERYYFKISGDKIRLKEIVLKYREGENFATQTMERLFHFFPLAISNIINIIDPDVIVMGGGLGNIDELYDKGLEKLPQFVFSDYIETKIVKPMHGDSSGVFGAALLWD